MPITDDLADMYATTASWSPLSSRDDYGVPTYGAATTYPARLVRRNRLVRTAEGDEVVSTAQLWLKGAPAVGPDDRVTLADGTYPTVLSVERFDDEAGASHTKVYFR